MENEDFMKRREASVRQSRQKADEATPAYDGARVPLEQVRMEAEIFDTGSFVQPEGFGEENLTVKGLDLNEIIGKIEWTPFFHFWGFTGKYPDIIYSSSQEEAAAAEELYEKALDRIAGAVLFKEMEASLVLAFYDAYAAVNPATGEDELVLLKNVATTHEQEMSGEAAAILERSRYDLSDREVAARIPLPRRQLNGSGYAGLAGYFPSEKQGEGEVKVSKTGVFVLKVEDRLSATFDSGSFEYLLRRSICSRLAEAMAGWMQETVCGEVHAVRAVFGEPGCPGLSPGRIVWELTDAREKIGESHIQDFEKTPVTAICGLLVAHPSAENFDF